MRDVAELAQTDIADHALAALRTSRVREVVMLGRRGPAQAAFTNAEIREFGELHGVDIIVDPADLVLDPLSAAMLDDNRVAAANVRTLHALAERGATGQPRRIVMRFLTSPTEVLGDGGQVCGVRVERNALVPNAAGELTLVGEIDGRTERAVLRRHDSARFAPGEKRQLFNHTDREASVLLAMPLAPPAAG